MKWYLKIAKKAYMKAIWEIRNNPDIRKNLIDKRSIPYKTHSKFYVNVYLNDNNWNIYAIINGNGKIAGYCDVKFSGKWKNKKMELGFKILPEFQGLGIGKFALNSLLKMKAEEYPNHKVILTVFKNNVRAYDFYKKHGFYPLSTKLINTGNDIKEPLTTMIYK